jgi:TolB-like protein/Flp pilus assembly protein TadD
LETEHFSVWWDATLRAGEAYDEVTEKALMDAKAVVVLWSPRSVSSRWVRAEATEAGRRGTLVPVMIEPCKRPIMFELTQKAELTHWTGDREDRNWTAFVADVRKFVEAGRAQPESPPAASTPTPCCANPSEPLLAVLPFDNLSNDPEMQFFSDGVSEEIMQRLMRGAKLKVVGRASSFQFRGDRKADAARALNCTHVLDGSVRRAAAKVPVAAHLVETSSQTTLWSDRFDGGLEDIFAVQDEISERIAGALDRKFSIKPAPAIDPEAYDFYLRGCIPAHSADECRQRIACLEEAVRRAPQFGNAWGMLATVQAGLWLLVSHSERDTIAAKAVTDAARALALDQGNPCARTAQYYLLPPWGHFLDAEAILSPLFRDAVAEPIVIQAKILHLASVGRSREAIAQARRGFELDPFNSFTGHMLGWSLIQAGRFEEARPLLIRALERFPDNYYVSALLIILATLEKDWAFVDRLMAPERLARYPLRQLDRVVNMTVSLNRMARDDAHRVAIDAIRKQCEKTGYVDVAFLAAAATFGGVDEIYNLAAQAKFRPAGDDSDEPGYDAYRTYLLFHPSYSDFRRDPRFVGICARLGLVDYWRFTQLWPDCVEELAPYYDFKAECEKMAYQTETKH